MPLGATVFSLIFGVICLVLGVAAYTGRDKAWMITRSVLPGQSGPALLYLGIFFFFLPIALAVMDILPPILSLLFSTSVLACLFIGVLGFFWLPRFMHPRWMRGNYRADKERTRPGPSTMRRNGDQ